ncbi:DUF3732 domain-containing protein [Collimonas fungivorans]|uniref:DUF3732 domain-containing protein n=1 Tax=Collimonas fungivorans TaxID=158899 RepID=UPI003FA3B0D2
MQFLIEQLVLWPVDEKNTIHKLKFESGKINIIHGRSGTGKSSIIAIIDYCLGASRCAIPVGIIRDSVDWFGLIVRIRGAAFLIARRTPGSRQTSKEFSILPFEGALPIRLDATHNDNQFKQAFNNLARLTNLPLAAGEDVGQHDGRPSYRDMAAFNFLPQHIVANPNTLFYKTDSYDHKERLKKVMPFALGIIDNDYVIKERERNQLQRQHDDLIKQQEIRRRSLTAWDADVAGLWNQAVELGLVKDDDGMTTDKRLSKLSEINLLFLADGLGAILQTPDYVFTNEKYKEAQTLEETLQKDVDALRRDVRGYERLAQRAIDFSGALQQEKRRVVNLDWLKDRLGGENECVVCGSHTNQLHEVVSRLEGEVNRVSGLSQALFERPIVDKEMEMSKSNLFELQGKLQIARMNRLKLQEKETGTKDSLSKVYVLMGRIQALVMTFAAMNNNDDIGNQIDSMAKELRVLEEYFKNSGRAAREFSVDKKLGELIEKYANGFKLERRGAISLDKTELTLSFKRFDDSKKEYLWEVGSGANWMGYHIATFLALHQFLSQDELSNSPVFRFLVIDQPSQVYFPSSASGVNQLDANADGLEKLKVERDVDVNATKRIFEMLQVGLKEANFQYQIIVLEHADESIWGGVPHTVEVANWKAEDQGLIPNSWQRKHTMAIDGRSEA